MINEGSSHSPAFIYYQVPQSYIIYTNTCTGEFVTCLSLVKTVNFVLSLFRLSIFSCIQYIILDRQSSRYDSFLSSSAKLFKLMYHSVLSSTYPRRLTSKLKFTSIMCWNIYCMIQGLHKIHGAQKRGMLRVVRHYFLPILALICFSNNPTILLSAYWYNNYFPGLWLKYCDLLFQMLLTYLFQLIIPLLSF